MADVVSKPKGSIQNGGQESTFYLPNLVKLTEKEYIKSLGSPQYRYSLWVVLLQFADCHGHAQKQMGEYVVKVEIGFILV